MKRTILVIINLGSTVGSAASAIGSAARLVAISMAWASVISGGAVSLFIVVSISSVDAMVLFFRGSGCWMLASLLLLWCFVVLAPCAFVVDSFC